MAVETQPVKTTDGFLKSAWSALKAIPEMLGTLGESGVEEGELWEYRLAEASRHRLGAARNIAWPVRDTDGIVLALMGRQVVRLGADAAVAARLGPEVEWVKLVAVAPEGLLGFVGYDASRPALLTLDGTVITLSAPANGTEQEQTSALLMESRRYDRGDIRIGISERGGRGTDIYFTTAGHPVNVSDCGSARCGQPSLGPDGNTVLYVVAPP